MPVSVSQKAEADWPGGAFWRWGQSSEEHHSSRKDTNSWTSPARNTAVQKPACCAHIRGCSGLVVEETRLTASPVSTLQLIPLYPGIVYSSWESVFHSRGHSQPREVTHSTRTGRYADFSPEKLLKIKNLAKLKSFYLWGMGSSTGHHSLCCCVNSDMILLWYT